MYLDSEDELSSSASLKSCCAKKSLFDGRETVFSSGYAEHTLFWPDFQSVSKNFISFCFQAEKKKLIFSNYMEKLIN